MCVRIPRSVLPRYRQMVQRNAFTPACASMCRCAAAAVGDTTSQHGHFQPPSDPEEGRGTSGTVRGDRVSLFVQ